MRLGKLLRKLRWGASITEIAMIFVVVAFLAFALGIIFGLLNNIQQTTNGTITIPSEFQNAISTSQSYAGLGLQILLVIGIMMAVTALLAVFGVRLHRE